MDLPNPRIKPTSPTLQADSLPAEPQEKFIVLTYSHQFLSYILATNSWNLTLKTQHYVHENKIELLKSKSDNTCTSSIQIKL